MKKNFFKKLVYGKVLFDERFWFLLKTSLLSDIISDEGMKMELLPYVEEIKRIFSEGSSREQVAFIKETVKVLQAKDFEKKAALLNFLQDFVILDLSVRMPLKRCSG